MGQQEIYDFLKKAKGKWFTSRDISAKLSLSIGSVTNSLKKLRNTNDVAFKLASERRNTYFYKFKR